MSTTIDKTQYPTLFSYALLSQSAQITTTYPFVVNDGYYGNKDNYFFGVTPITGGTPNGKNQTDVARANTELAQLIIDLTNVVTNTSVK